MTETNPAEKTRTQPRNFLILLSGARPEVLARCPTEHVKFQSLGWAILITCGMATVSMWFALTSVLGFNAAFSLPVAILWGLIIMGIDRWLVTSMPLDGRRKFLIAAPRLALAILLGSLISTPIVLRIFQSEINNQISVIKQDNEAAFLSSQQHSAVAARVTQWQNTVNNLQSVISSGGQQPINPADDPEVEGLTSQLNTERTIAAQDYKAWQCQLYGGCNSPQGDGPLAQASEARYNNDEAEINKLNQEIAAREQALQTTNTASNQTRLQQAESSLPNAKSELAAAQAEENTLLNNFELTNSDTNGLLIRLKALDQLSAGDGTVQAARILLFLLFLIIEVLPVTVKLLQPQGNYEKILRQEIANELRKARWDMRGSGSPLVGTLPQDDDLRPSAMEAAELSGARPRRPVRDQLDAELEKVWEQHTRAEPVGNWESRAETGFLPADEETTGASRLEDMLRRLPDPRPQAGYEERQGGIERRYGDDDL
jgi:hypothetical protein